MAAVSHDKDVLNGFIIGANSGVEAILRLTKDF